MTYTIDFVRHRNKFFIIFATIAVLCIASLIFQGLNLGIDFVSGTRLDLDLHQKVDAAKSNALLEKLGYAKPNVRVGGNAQNVVIFRWKKALDPKAVEQIRSAFSQEFKTKVDKQESKVNPIIARETAQNAIYSLLFASVGIILYITIRFEYRFAVAAVISLLYNALFTVGMFSIFHLEVDIVFIAAVLTVVGYAVNDTIVIFDRIRENTKAEAKTWEQLAQLVNESLHQTLVRSINTVLTVVFAAAALAMFGGESIRNFAIALLFGLVSGAASSILLASQIWVVWKWSSLKKRGKVAKLATE